MARLGSRKSLGERKSLTRKLRRKQFRIDAQISGRKAEKLDEGRRTFGVFASNLTEAREIARKNLRIVHPDGNWKIVKIIPFRGSIPNPASL